jgi:hypothetical protein
VRAFVFDAACDVVGNASGDISAEGSSDAARNFKWGVSRGSGIEAMGTGRVF